MWFFSQRIKKLMSNTRSCTVKHDLEISSFIITVLKLQVRLSIADTTVFTSNGMKISFFGKNWEMSVSCQYEGNKELDRKILVNSETDK